MVLNTCHDGPEYHIQYPEIQQEKLESRDAVYFYGHGFLVFQRA